MCLRGTDRAWGVCGCIWQAARGANPEAQHLLGQLHESGELAQFGVLKDAGKALALYRWGFIFLPPKSSPAPPDTAYEYKSITWGRASP
jgi:hypothetical protein